MRTPLVLKLPLPSFIAETLIHVQLVDIQFEIQLKDQLLYSCGAWLLQFSRFFSLVIKIIVLLIMCIISPLNILCQDFNSSYVYEKCFVKRIKSQFADRPNFTICGNIFLSQLLNFVVVQEQFTHAAMQCSIREQVKTQLLFNENKNVERKRESAGEGGDLTQNTNMYNWRIYFLNLIK